MPQCPAGLDVTPQQLPYLARSKFSCIRPDGSRVALLAAATSLPPGANATLAAAGAPLDPSDALDAAAAAPAGRPPPKQLAGGVIAAIVIGCLAVVFLVGALSAGAFLRWRKRRAGELCGARWSRSHACWLGRCGVLGASKRGVPEPVEPPCVPPLLLFLIQPRQAGARRSWTACPRPGRASTTCLACSSTHWQAQAHRLCLGLEEATAAAPPPTTAAAARGTLRWRCWRRQQRRLAALARAGGAARWFDHERWPQHAESA